MYISTTLIAAGDPEWNSIFTRAFRKTGSEIHSTLEGETAVNLVRNNVYDHILVDESLKRIRYIEFLFNLTDLLKYPAKIIVTGDDLRKFEKVWKHCGVTLSGTRDKILTRIKSGIPLSRNHPDVSMKDILRK